METGNSETIVDLDKVLLKNFLKPNHEISRYELKRLTAPGENYGSTMWAIKIFTKDKSSTGTKNCEEVINAVGKMVPNNEFLQKVFDSPVTFRKELELYRTIIPTLQAFQLKQGVKNPIDCFPVFYGGRMGLGEDFDQQAIIILENLKDSGYDTENRMIGFDLKTTKAIIKHLALFHAVPLALKLTDLEEFNLKVRPYLNRRNTTEEELDKFTKTHIKKVLKIIQKYPKLQKMSQRIEKAFETAAKDYNKDIDEINECFATILHNDFWVNNVMIKNDSKDIKVKIIDFQILGYGSPFKDLLFFLFSSVQNNVIETNFDDLVAFYYKEFIQILNQLKIDTTGYKFEEFLAEMEVIAKKEILMQATFMLNPIFMAPGSLNSMEEISEETMISDEEESQEHKDKLNLILSEFINRNWI